MISSKFKVLVLALSVINITGCAVDPNYQLYVAQQTELHKSAEANRKPLVEISAQAGQTITGLDTIKVYMPAEAPIIQQAAPNQWIGVLDRVVGAATVIGGAAIAQKGAVETIKAMGAVIPKSTTTPVVNNTSYTNSGNTTTTSTNKTNTTTVDSGNSGSSGNSGNTTTTTSASYNQANPVDSSTKNIPTTTTTAPITTTTTYPSTGSTTTTTLPKCSTLQVGPIVPGTNCVL